MAGEYFATQIIYLCNEIPHISMELHMYVAAQSNMILIFAWMSAAGENHSLLPAAEGTWYKLPQII